jgi:hypothetical protein
MNEADEQRTIIPQRALRVPFKDNSHHRFLWFMVHMPGFVGELTQWLSVVNKIAGVYKEME